MSRAPVSVRVATFALSVMWPAIAQACPFCFSGSPRVRMAFFGTTILLSLLPLGLIGVGVVWLFRSGRLSFGRDFEETDYSKPEQATTADP
jgi:hypothetical protein